MEYFNNYSVVLIGTSGALARGLENILISKGLSFFKINISRKDKIHSQSGLYNHLDKYWPSGNSFIVINTIASLSPKNSSDKYINTKLPLDLLNYKKYKKIFLIHISSNNVSVEMLEDRYTNQKKIAENKLNSSTAKNFVIFRLPLLIPIDDIIKGHDSPQYKFLLKLLKLPLVAIIPPSRNIYRPMDVLEASNLIIKNIYKPHIKKIYSFNGSKKMNLKAISKYILKYIPRKRTLFIFQIPLPWNVIDWLLIKSDHLSKIFKSDTKLQQFLKLYR